jgi:phytoene synthase
MVRIFVTVCWGLPSAQRQTLVTIHAFQVETTRIVDDCLDTGVARTKLDWWRAEIDRPFAGDPQYPVTRALHPRLSLFNLPEEYFWKMLDGVTMDLDYDAYPSFTELTLYVHRRGSIPDLLAAEVLGYQEPTRYTTLCSRSWGIATALRATL